MQSHQIDFKIDKNYGVGLKFKDDEGHKCISVCYLRPRRAHLNITSWAGICPGATHFYASIKIYALSHKNLKTGESFSTFGRGDDLKPKEMLDMRIDITRKLTKKDFNFEEDDFVQKNKLEGYQVGDYTDCFNSEEAAIRRARKEFKRIFGEGWELKKD
jgi:hypothetical protein